MPNRQRSGSDPSAEDPVVQTAIEWMILMRSGMATESDATAFNDWRQADVQHDAVCRRIEQTLDHFGFLSDARISDETVHSALRFPTSRRRVLRNMLALTGVGVGLGLGVMRSSIYQQTFADMRTATGQRHDQVLEDGSYITLNARTAITFKLVDGIQILHLLKGELMMRRELNHSAGSFIQTREGFFQSSYGHFSVRQNEDSTRVNVLDGSLTVKSSSSPVSLALSAGQTAEISALGGQILSGLSPYAETAWIDGKLQVDNRQLSDVVASLSDYWFGFIYVSPRAATLRVSGMFPLDDVPFTLNSLQQNMPIVVRHIGAVWYYIDAA